MLKGVLQEYLQNNQALLNSSINQHSVFCFGHTGTGKSTLLNYLCGKQLVVQNEGGFKQISLLNPNDQSSFQIGQDFNSSTLLPQFAMYNEICLFDLAGLEDTRGLEYSLLNACFIKKLVEQAKSAVFLFVIDQDSILSKRGQQFLEFIEKVKQLLPEIEDKPYQNALVITKAEQQTSEDFNSFLKNKNTVLFNLDEKLKLQKFKMSKPNASNQICYEDRNQILNFIQSTHKIQYKRVNIDAIYSLRETNLMNQIYEQEMDLICNQLNPEIDYTNLNIEQLDEQKLRVISFQQNFFSSLSNSDLISLLRVISESNYQFVLQIKIKKIENVQNRCLQKIQFQKDSINKQIDMDAIAQKCQALQQAENRLQQMYNQRQKRRSCSIF